MEHPLSATCNRALDILEKQLGNGQISTFDEVESLVISQMSKSEPGLALSTPIFSIRCRGAQAMYNSRKVCWVLDQTRRAANRVVIAGGGEDIEASHPPLANADTPGLCEPSGFPYASSQAVGANPASSTLPVTSPTRKRKRRTLRNGPRRYTPDGEMLQTTKCPCCEQTFSGAVCDQRSNLKRHVEHKHRHPLQASSRVCLKCGQDFPRNDYLRNHEKKCL